MGKSSTNFVVLARFREGQASGRCVLGRARAGGVERVVRERASDFADERRVAELHDEAERGEQFKDRRVTFENAAAWLGLGGEPCGGGVQEEWGGLQLQRWRVTERFCVCVVFFG